MLTTTLIPIVAAFAIVVAMGPFMIPFLIRLKVGNTEREELVSHQKKTGTPTMGGLMILSAYTIVSLVYYFMGNKEILPVLLVTLGFGAIGFVDDFLKVVKKDKDGFKAKQKMVCEFVVTLLFAIYTIVADVSLEMIIPFAGGRTLNVGYLAIVIMFLGIIGTVNGTNFTDGLDGLASSVTVVVALFFVIASYIRGTMPGLAPVGCAMIGALLGFLVYNHYPAKVFMGDTGSLALGGFVAAFAYMLQMPMFIVIAGLLYWIEILSVMIQVTYFRKTGGKRFFRMAPIHHHFELGGWSEVKVVAVFTGVTVLLSAAGILGLII